MNGATLSCHDLSNPRHQADTMTGGLRYAHRRSAIAAIAANEPSERAVPVGARATGTSAVTSVVVTSCSGHRPTLTYNARLSAVLGEILMAQ